MVMPNKPHQRPMVLSDPDIRPIPRSANDSDKLDERPSVANQSHERELPASKVSRGLLAADKPCKIDAEDFAI